MGSGPGVFALRSFVRVLDLEAGLSFCLGEGKQPRQLEGVVFESHSAFCSP